MISEHVAYHNMLLYQWLKFQVWMWISLKQYWFWYFTNNIHPLTTYWCWLLLIILIDIAGLGHHVKVFLSCRWLSSWHFLCSILDEEFVIYIWERGILTFFREKEAFWPFLDRTVAWFYLLSLSAMFKLKSKSYAETSHWSLYWSNIIFSC